MRVLGRLSGIEQAHHGFGIACAGLGVRGDVVRIGERHAELHVALAILFYQPDIFRMPGMGTMSGPIASNQARASCAGVQDFPAASSRSFAASSRFFEKLSPWNRGLLRRQSSSSRSSIDVICPLRKPRPSGL